MKNVCKKFLLSEKGATSVEYAIMASLIAAVIAGVVFTMGGKVLNLFSNLNSLFP